MGPQGRTAEQRIAAVASSAKGLVTRRELLSVGITHKQIRRRLQKGALIPEYLGVYRVGHRAPSVQTSYLAAVKACGERALLSGLAAAHLYRLTMGPAPPPEVLTHTERRIEGIVTHRARAGTDRRDATEYDGIPVTTVPRTLVDIAQRLTPEALARAVHEAAVRFRTRPEHIDAVLTRRPNSPGARKVRRVLRGDTPALLSELERAFFALLRANDLPLPITNRPTGGHYIDCRWPEHKLTVELDSYAFHNTRHSWERDRQRDREARERGDRLIRYTWEDVIERPDASVEELRRLLT
jgi:very-short-patch-repair endonuclease